MKPLCWSVDSYIWINLETHPVPQSRNHTIKMFSFPHINIIMFAQNLRKYDKNEPNNLYFIGRYIAISNKNI